MRAKRHLYLFLHLGISQRFTAVDKILDDDKETENSRY